jgi:hypothetical protein
MMMRPILALPAILLVWLAAATADAYAIRYAVTPETNLATSDTVQLDFYLDADPGLQLLSIGVLWETDKASFQPLASSAPAYFLYTPTPGPGEADRVVPLRDPWAEWPGDKPPGFSQVNLDYSTPAPDLLPAAASGLDIWIASLVFHVDNPLGLVDGFLVTLETSSNVLYSNGVTIDPADVPITRIPEPASLGLLLLGIGVALRAHRR